MLLITIEKKPHPIIYLRKHLTDRKRPSKCPDASEKFKETERELLAALSASTLSRTRALLLDSPDGEHLSPAAELLFFCCPGTSACRPVLINPDSMTRALFPRFLTASSPDRLYRRWHSRHNHTCHTATRGLGWYDCRKFFSLKNFPENYFNFINFCGFFCISFGNSAPGREVYRACPRARIEWRGGASRAPGIALRPGSLMGRAPLCPHHGGDRPRARAARWERAAVMLLLSGGAVKTSRGYK